MSAAEKFGAEVALEADVPPAALPDDVPDDDSVELPPDTDGEDGDGLVGEEEDCARANVENANKTAAVVVPRALSMGECLQWLGNCTASSRKRRADVVFADDKEALAPRTRIERATCPLGGGCSIH